VLQEGVPEFRNPKLSYLAVNLPDPLQDLFEETLSLSSRAIHSSTPLKSNLNIIKAIYKKTHS